MAVVSNWRLRSRAVIADVLEGLPATASYKEVKKALQDAYPFHERGMHPYKMWLLEQKKALDSRFPRDGRRSSREQTAVTHYGIRCSWCAVRPAPGRCANPWGKGCLSCTAARTEWEAGAKRLVQEFALGTPPGIVADRLEEAGYDACARLLRKEQA